MTIDPKDYTGLCQDPGKFEGEPNATRYYWEVSMQGDGEWHYPTVQDTDETTEGHQLYIEFTVDGDEDEAFGKDAGLHCGDTVIVWESNCGFVNMVAFASREAAMHWLSEHAGTF